MGTHRKHTKVIPVLAATMAVVIVGLALQPASAYPRPGRTDRVSLASGGLQSHPPGGIFFQPGTCYGSGHVDFRLFDISRDGRYVAFTSSAPDLVAGDKNATCDVFRHDRATGTTIRISVSSAGAEGVGVCLSTGGVRTGSMQASISADGRFVAFSSCAMNLVADDTNLAMDVFVHDVKRGITERVSIASDGTESEGLCVTSAETSTPNQEASISGSGRYVAFAGGARNLDSNQTFPSCSLKIFVHDRKTSQTEWASFPVVDDDPTTCPLSFADQSKGTSGSLPTISDDGRYIAFGRSVECTNSPRDWELVYVSDRKKGRTEVVSSASDGSPGRCRCVFYGPSRGNGTYSLGGRQISADGRFVVFASQASGYVPNEHNDTLQGSGDYPAASDVFVKDLKTGRTERVSVTPTGHEGFNSSHPSISPDGRYVIFDSPARIFWDGTSGPLDFTGQTDFPATVVYVHDRVTGALTAVSKSFSGSVPNARSLAGALSDGGQYGAFISYADDLVEGDSNDAYDFFVHDLGREVGAGDLAGSGAVKAPASPGFDRTGSLTDFDSITDLNSVLTDRGANLYGASLSYRSQYEDLFVRIQLEDMPYGHGSSLAGDPAILYGLDLTANGVRYQVRAQRFASDSIAGLDPIQLSMGGASFGLFRCNDDTPLCTKVATLKGGYGTTGVEVVVALPLSALGLEGGGELSGLEVFTALGSYEVGTVKTLDTMKLPN